MSRIDDRNSALLTGQRLIGLVFVTVGSGFLLAWLAIPVVEMMLSDRSRANWPGGGRGYSDWLATLRWLALIGAICTLMGSWVFGSAKSVCLWCARAPWESDRIRGQELHQGTQSTDASQRDPYKAEG